MELLDRFWAEFSPAIDDDLSLDAQTCKGLTCEWQVAWIIETGKYRGEFACIPLIEYRENESPAFGWVPLCDLKILACKEV